MTSWHVEAWTRPKAGLAPHENEDAHAVAIATDGTCIAAVADGATETAFARAWAQALAEAAVHSGTVLGAWTQAQSDHAAYVAQRQATLPWYAAQKAEEGAAAALLVVRLAPDGRFTAEAVGDCNLFVLEGGQIAAAWPFASADAFTHHPVLVSSQQSPRAVGTTQGHLPAGATLVLATDALAAYQLAQGAGVLEAALEDPDAWLDAARARGLRNDDTTLVLIRASGP